MDFDYEDDFEDMSDEERESALGDYQEYQAEYESERHLARLEESLRHDYSDDEFYGKYD